MTSPPAPRFVLSALLVDLVTLLLLLLAAGGMAAAMSEPSGIATFGMVLIYIAFLAGVFLLRKLRPIPPVSGVWLRPPARAILAGFFGLVLALVLSWQLGFFESFNSADPMVLGEGEAAAYFVFAPGSWFAVSMFYILFLAFPVNESVSFGGGRYAVFAGLGLMTPMLLLIALVAQGAAFIPPTASKPLMFVMAWAVLVALFAPPRLLFASRFAELRSRETAVALLSLAAVAAVCAWWLVAR